MIIAEKFTSSYQIIIPSEPTPSLDHAAKELKKYLTAITGAYIPYFWDTRDEQPSEIVIGFTTRGGFTPEEKEELGTEGFIIKSEGEKIFILGSSGRGALYGVYTFLEEYCGVRYFTDTFEKVPHTEKLEIPPISPNKQIPVFAYRNPYWWAVSSCETAAKLKINGSHGRIYESVPQLGNFEIYHGGFCHTLAALNDSTDYWNQPCLSDEAVHDRVLKNCRKILTEHPDATILSITQLDGEGGACKCDKCRPINEAEESDAATNILFVNRIAEELEDEFPNVIFDTFAYRSTRKPPKTIKPRHNVVIRMCTIEKCNRHPIEDCPEHPGYPQDDTFKNYIDRWSEISSHLAVWNYTTNFTNYPVIFPNWKGLLRDEKYFADKGVESVFEQGNLACPNGEFGELRAYVLAKTLWNPYMSESEYWGHIEEFIDNFYGHAAPYIYDYLKYTLECSENSHFNVYFDNPTNYVFEPGIENHLEACRVFIGKASELFDKAENAVKDDSFALANVRRSRIQLYDYIDFHLRGERFEMTEGTPEYEAKTAEIIANNEVQYNYRKMYDVSGNHEFNSLDKNPNPDLSDYALRW